uniref:Uncharacterized protein n=1 Tax=Romanomermis culicivorax TaxID=13658 RepID=A0A915HZJ8_ROMCU
MFKLPKNSVKLDSPIGASMELRCKLRKLYDQKLTNITVVSRISLEYSGMLESFIITIDAIVSMHAAVVFL